MGNDLPYYLVKEEGHQNSPTNAWSTILASGAWYQALTLAERIAVPKEVSHTVQQELAARRMHRWQAQYPFSDPQIFAKRLAQDGLTVDTFHDLLGQSSETVHKACAASPHWLETLADAFCGSHSTVSIPFSHSLHPEAEYGFLQAIQPIMHAGLNQFRCGVRALAHTSELLPFDPNNIARILFVSLPPKLIWMLSRVMVLEMHVANLEGKLHGTSPQARFAHFLDLLRKPDIALSLLQEYPVLARTVTACISHWVAVSLEFLQHLSTDWSCISATFDFSDNAAMLVRVYPCQGDSHHGGRSVLVAEFTSGHRLVYKPKSLAVDVHFQALLHWLNEHGAQPSFRTLQVLDRGTYGWVEFVDQAPCESQEGLQRFYQRQGAYMAVLYALHATDFHFENVIAAGEHPMLVDLETLFHPYVHTVPAERGFFIGLNALDESVLALGLLPLHVKPSHALNGIDIGGLSASEDQVIPNHWPYWDKAGTDAMRLRRGHGTLGRGRHLPTLRGNTVQLQDYVDEIERGFSHMYALLANHKETLLATHSPLTAFADDTIRVILRPTRIYGLLLQESFHPDLLRNALDRDLFFDRLWILATIDPHLAEVVPAEREDLWQGDIPRFTTKPNSCDLYTSNGQRMPCFLEKPGLFLARRRLANLDGEDHERQRWYIRAAITTAAMTKPKEKRLKEARRAPHQLATPEQLLTAAKRVGDRLVGLTHRRNDHAIWITPTLVDHQHWSLRPMQLDLYDGIPGVALFLAYLGKTTQAECYTQLARAAACTMRQQVEQAKSLLTAVGAYQGWGGVIYALTHLGKLWNDYTLIQEAARLAIDQLPRLIAQDQQLDIIAGTGGCLASLLALYTVAPSERLLKVAIQCGDHLVATAQRMHCGLGWVAQEVANQPLAGFSHGIAGIAWALLQLAAITKHEGFRNTATEAFCYERSLFCSKEGNWRDLRESGATLAHQESSESFMTAWCHGAPGIGLARLYSLPYIHDADIDREISSALHYTLTQGFGSNHSLCHGDLGNLELVHAVSQVYDDAALAQRVRVIAGTILDDIAHRGWLCGIPSGTETLGLMTGLAGIGYGLLRLAHPNGVPSVLVLAPPTVG